MIYSFAFEARRSRDFDVCRLDFFFIVETIFFSSFPQQLSLFENKIESMMHFFCTFHRFKENFDSIIDRKESLNFKRENKNKWKIVNERFSLLFLSRLLRWTIIVRGKWRFWPRNVCNRWSEDCFDLFIAWLKRICQSSINFHSFVPDDDSEGKHHENGQR